MKRLQTIIFSLCITVSVYLYVEQNDVSREQASTIIPFFSQDDDNDTNDPSGRYWPAEKKMTPVINKIPINSASAYIRDISYSDVIEEKKLLPDQEGHYLGYFIHPDSEEKIYLYGTKDTITPNDATVDTIIYNDNDDDDEDN